MIFKVTQFVNGCVTSGETETDTDTDTETEPETGYVCEYESLCTGCTFVLLRNVTAIKIHWHCIFNGFIAVLV